MPSELLRITAFSWSDAFAKAKHDHNSSISEHEWLYTKVNNEFGWITKSGAFRPCDQNENSALASVYRELDREEFAKAARFDELELENARLVKLNKKLAQGILDLCELIPKEDELL